MNQARGYLRSYMYPHESRWIQICDGQGYRLIPIGHWVRCWELEGEGKHYFEYYCIKQFLKAIPEFVLPRLLTRLLSLSFLTLIAEIILGVRITNDSLDAKSRFLKVTSIISRLTE